MNTMPQTEAQEINLQERATEALTDDSLPASQVIEDQNKDSERSNMPCYVP